MAKYECSVMVELLFVVEADSLEAAKRLINISPDDAVEAADGVAFASDWSILDGAGGAAISISQDDLRFEAESLSFLEET